MKAVGYRTPGAIERTDSLLDLELPRPEASGHDLLVEVRAVSVNPVDYKIRRGAIPPEGEARILGWDAVGTVVAVGDKAQGFAPGERVYYAGALNRPGTNSEYHLVDARLAAVAPRKLSDGEAAALPLTSITAWEMLFERLDVARPVPGAANAVLIVGGAGGVGSIAIQLLRARTDLTVIATASRPETRDWCLSLGAHHVIDHGKPLAAQVEALQLGAPGIVFSTTETCRHLDEIVALIAPQGRFGLIDDPENLTVNGFKGKSVSIHWEFMFTRSLHATPDMDRQGALLADVAALVDAGAIRSTLSETMGPISATNLKRAHALLESGKARGKIVLEGF
jgi:zinc-binding alcohol dehydrogenase family protein